MNYFRIKSASMEGAVAIADLPTRRERATLPQDVTNVIDMKHPLLKYTTHATSLAGALAGKLYKKNPSVGLLAGMATGNIVGSNIHAEAEKHLAKPYMKHLTEEIDKKYLTKKGSLIYPQTEYIFDSPINWVHDIKENSPHEIRSVVESKHPVASRLQMLGSAIGGAVSLKTKKLLPAGIGVAAGTIGKELMMDHYMKPYKNKFISDVNKKYKVKN